MWLDDTVPADHAARDKLLARIVDALPIGIAVCRGPDAEIVYLNAAAGARHGTPARDAEIPPQRIFEDRSHSLTIGGDLYRVVTSSDASHHHHRVNELTKRAFYDDLTGLPKRDLFERTIRSMIEENCPPFALSFIDIDNFKYVITVTASATSC